METWDAIRSRRNVRNYKPEPVPKEDLRQILEAGRRAPSGGNYQHWDFIVVTDRQQLAQLATVWQGAQFIASAPAAIALVMPHPVDPDALNTDEYDLGQATYAMMSSTDPLITDIWRTGSGQSKRFGEPLAVADGDGIRRHPARARYRPPAGRTTDRPQPLPAQPRLHRLTSHARTEGQTAGRMPY
jgi:nitroreductase